MPKTAKKERIVAVSGGFDPIHVGHIRMFRESRKFGDKLVVILNNDHWLRKKKGYVFMPQDERKEIIKTIAGIDKVVLTSHKPNSGDMSVCRELKKSARIFSQTAETENLIIFLRRAFANLLTAKWFSTSVAAAKFNQAHGF